MNRLSQFIYLLLSFWVTPALAAEDFSVTDLPDRLVIDSAYGSRSFKVEANGNNTGDYKVVIPLNRFSKQPGDPAAPLAPPQQAPVIIAPIAIAPPPAAPASGANQAPSPETVSGVHKPSPGTDLFQEAAIEQINDLYYDDKPAEALKQAEALLKDNPQNARAWLMKGSLHHTLGDKAQAELSWRKAAEIAPTHPDLKKIQRITREVLK